MTYVRWQVRDDGNSTWAKHVRGPYAVYVTDCDGDGSTWSIELDGACLASGDVMEVCKTERYHFAIAKDAAIAALESILSAEEPSVTSRDHQQPAKGYCFHVWKNGSRRICTFEESWGGHHGPHKIHDFVPEPL